MGGKPAEGTRQMGPGAQLFITIFWKHRLFTDSRGVRLIAAVVISEGKLSGDGGMEDETTDKAHSFLTVRRAVATDRGPQPDGKLY